MSLLRGQKVALQEGIVPFTVKWSKPKKQMDVDVSAFLLQQGRCMQDEHFIFYSQPDSPDHAVHYHKTSDEDGTITIDLPNVPPTIDRIAITLTIHEGETKQLQFREIDALTLTIGDQYTYQFGEDLAQETAIVVGEVYRHQGAWKFTAIASGFNGGLQALCENYGLEIIDDAPAEPIAPATKPINIQKMNVSLDKKQSISIAKSEKIVATLEWANPRKDLDLYAFYVLQDGTTGKVYYRHMGEANKAPYMTLDGDSRTAGQETIVIHQPSKVKYVLIAAYSAVSNGIGSFKKMKAQAVVDNQLGQRITSGLFQKNNFAYWVAIAKIDLREEHNIQISHVESYSKSGTERSPMLYTDGHFEMNKGPIEFK